MRAFALALTLSTIAIPAHAVTEIVLNDGRVLRGVEVNIGSGLYLAIDASGETVRVPARSVVQVRIAQAKTQGDDASLDEPAVGRFDAPIDLEIFDGPVEPIRDSLSRTGTDESSLLAESRAGARGERPSEPRPPALPTLTDLRENLGEPARFSGDEGDSRFEPRADWGVSDINRKNDFRPARFSSPPVDPTYVPTSDWDLDPNRAAEWAPSRWQRGKTGWRWTPQDGFRFTQQPAD